MAGLSKPSLVVRKVEVELGQDSGGVNTGNAKGRPRVWAAVPTSRHRFGYRGHSKLPTIPQDALVMHPAPGRC